MSTEQAKSLDARAAELLTAGKVSTLKEGRLLARKQQLEEEIQRNQKSLNDYQAKLKNDRWGEKRRKRTSRAKIILGAAVIKAGLAEVDYESKDSKKIILFKHGLDEGKLIAALSNIANNNVHVLSNEDKVLIEIGREMISSLKRDSNGVVVKDNGKFFGYLSAKRNDLINNYMTITATPFIENNDK